MDIKNYNPDDVGVNNGNYFGFPFTVEESELVLLSAPWDVTTSYGGGAASAPDAIIEASTQLDFYDPDCPNIWQRGIATADIDYSIQDRSARLRAIAKRIIEGLEHGSTTLGDYLTQRQLERINTASEELALQLFAEADKLLSEGKIVGLVGGDHSTPLGVIKAVAKHHKGVGILHIDAHRDLRKAYEGFTQSHASIMFNVLSEVPRVSRLVQVGVRDYCTAEAELALTDERVVSFEQDAIDERRFAGESWGAVCGEIVAALPEKVYISFDIDGLSPDNCPSTGTPVPGGLSFGEAVHLIKSIVRSGRKIVGFDLVEVACGKMGDLDANVGARMLYKLCCQTLKSNTKQ